MARITLEKTTTNEGLSAKEMKEIFGGTIRFRLGEDADPGIKAPVQHFTSTTQPMHEQRDDMILAGNF